MGRPPQLGVYAFPQVPPHSAMLEVARRSEALGFDSLWLADETSMAYPGRELGFEELIYFWPGTAAEDAILERLASELFPSIREASDARLA